MAIFLQRGEMLPNKIKKKQKEIDEMEKNIKYLKTQLQLLRKMRLLAIFTGEVNRCREKIEAYKQNIRTARFQVDKLHEEIFGFAKGYEGEERVAVLLEEELPDDFYIISGKKINKQGRKGEIDHLVVGPRGIICIEVKNISGRFYFDTEEEGWLKVPYSQPHSLPVPISSPLCQVNEATHLLRRLLLEKCNLQLDVSRVSWHGMVVFTNNKCSFPGVKDRLTLKTPLLLPDELIPYINSLPENNYLNNSKIEKLSRFISTRS